MAKMARKFILLTKKKDGEQIIIRTDSISYICDDLIQTLIESPSPIWDGKKSVYVQESAEEIYAMMYKGETSAIRKAIRGLKKMSKKDLTQLKEH